MVKSNKSLLLVSANTRKDLYPIYPIGISYLKTYLEKELPEYHISTYDMNIGGMEGLAELLNNNHFRYIGMSLRNIDDNDIFSKNSFVVAYREISETIRKLSDSPLILGGSGFSIYPDLLLDELKADYGIKGEGERSLKELIMALDEAASIASIDGAVFRCKDGSIVVNNRLEYSDKLDLDFDQQLIDYYWDRSGMLNIQTKRGCPFKCIYCSYPVIEGRRIRTLDPVKIIETLKDVYFNKHINYVFFTDSVFNIDRGYNRELANMIIESGVKVNWGAYFSPRDLTFEDLQLYKKAGLTHIEFGTESFSQAQLDNYKKGFNWEDVLEKSRFCDDLGIFYAHFLILGGFGETNETLQETLDHSRLLTNTVIFPYIGMRIYPETELYEIAMREGVITSRKDLLDPTYYLSPNADVTNFKERARETGAKWIFPDDNSEELMARFRAKKRRGPLWEYLRY